MTFKYEKLEVWQLARRLIKVCYPLFGQLPDSERFGLTAQGRRAAISVALNIAEGSARLTDRDFALFVNRSMASLFEVDATLKLAVDLGYLHGSDLVEAGTLIKAAYYKLLAFQKVLQRRSSVRRLKDKDSESE